MTLQVRPEVGRMRRRDLHRAIRLTMLRSGHREHFRICHYSIQRRTVLLICEAESANGLSRGVQGFSSAMARRCNKILGRRGAFFEQRYARRELRTAREVRNALARVLNAWRGHVPRRRGHCELDPFSSAAMFAGWSDGRGPLRRPSWLEPEEPIPVAAPRSWLLAHGWRRAGPLRPGVEAPPSSISAAASRAHTDGPRTALA